MLPLSMLSSTDLCVLNAGVDMLREWLGIADFDSTVM